ncbi:MAG TPA: Uma2 family endonuclease [Planctomycetota bacterium]|nr:Uma2 family endonuclease [Planctomycetota bacterium]
MQSTAKKWTEAELMALPKDGHKYELVNGELEMSPAGTFGHGDVIMHLSIVLGSWVRKNKLGELFDGQSGFWMKSGNLRSPDISFIGRERIGQLDKSQGFLSTAPELAIEVLSPNDTNKLIAEKMEDYFASGCRLAWVVNPLNKTVAIYHAPTPDRLLRGDDRLEGEDVVPGFSIAVHEIFEPLYAD